MKNKICKIFFALSILFVPSFTHASGISSIDPVYVTPGETEVIINGSGFGDSSVSKYIYFGYTPAYSTSWTDTQIRVKAPYSLYASGNIKISGLFTTQTCGYSRYVGGSVCTESSSWQEYTSQNYYLLPKVTNKTEFARSKGIFEMAGKYFGDNQGSVKVGDSYCQILKWTDTYIKCQLPEISNQWSSISYTISVPTSNNYALTGSTNFLPSLSSDTYSYYQTYLKQSKITDVWNKYTGKNVIIAVLDSGIDLNNDDLRNSLWINYKEKLNNKIDDDKNGYIDDYYGYNFVANNANMSPYSSHGTMVAGIIAAKRNNNYGIAGIAPDSKIMPLTVCSDLGCPVQAVVKAIKYAVDNGANIINMSLGGDGSLGYTPDYDEAIKYAYDHNVLIVASAGNGDTEGNGTRGQDLDSIKASPVCNEDGINMILGVGAVDDKNVRTEWTNYSMKYVDLSAPGTDIFSTAVPIYTDNGTDSYDFMDGTSFSAPIVTGVAAMLKEKYPSWKNYELISQLISRSDSFPNGYNVYGNILNAKNIIENDYPKSEITSVSPAVIDGGQNIVKIIGKNFYSNVKIKFTNSQFTGYAPTSIMTINNDSITFDISRWSAIQPSAEKYSISIDSSESSNNWNNPINIEIKNIIKTQDTAVNANTNSPVITSPTVGITSSNVDKKLAEKLKGKILLQIESHGEAWYVNPKDGSRYYMANGNAAYDIMRKLSIGITNKDFTKLSSNKIWAKTHSGKIFIKTEDLGKAYYVDFSGNIHYLKDGAEAYNVMRELGLGIKNSDLEKIQVGE